LLVSRLAVGWPLRSTLVISNGGARNALKGSGAGGRGLFAVPMPLTVGFPRDGVLLLVPLAGEARIVELDAAVAFVVGT